MAVARYRDSELDMSKRPTPIFVKKVQDLIRLTASLVFRSLKSKEVVSNLAS